MKKLGIKKIKSKASGKMGSMKSNLMGYAKAGMFKPGKMMKGC